MSKPPLKRGSNSSSVLSLSVQPNGGPPGSRSEPASAIGTGSALLTPITPSTGGGSALTGPVVVPVAQLAAATQPSHPQWASQRPAELSRLLYPRCVQILTQLRSIEALNPYLDYVTSAQFASDASNASLAADVGVVPPGCGLELDPVSTVWRMMRVYAPFAILYNMLAPPGHELEVVPPEECVEQQAMKPFLYRFVMQCKEQLSLNTERDLFIFKNVFSDSVSEFLRPLNTLQILLDKLVAKGLLASPPPLDASLQSGRPASQSSAGDGDVPPPQAANQRDKVVDELLHTERRYVNGLEMMLKYHDAMVAANYKREVIQKMFPYLPKLVDFQRRFLVGVEYHARLPPHEQQFGWLFQRLQDDFLVYEGYTIGQREATDVAAAEVANLAPFKSILEPVYELPSMLLSPVQRVMRYPMLLKELLKHTPESWPYYDQLRNGLGVMQDMMFKVNETQRKAENESVRRDLTERLKDSNNNRPDISKMGELLLTGTFPVTISTLGEQETDYRLYLFDRLLLCCRDKTLVQRRTGSLKMRPARSSSSQRSLELKGRIFLDYITSVAHTRNSQGAHILSLAWGTDDASEYGSFAIRVLNEEQAMLWEQTLRNTCPSLGGAVASFGPTRNSADGKRSVATITNPSRFSSSGSGSDGAKFYEDRHSTASSTVGTPVEDLRKLSVVSTDRMRWSAAGAESLSENTNSSSSIVWNPRYTAPAASSNRMSRSSSTSVTNADSTPTSRSPSAAHLPVIQAPRPRLPDGLDLKGKRKVRVQVEQDSFIILVDPDIDYDALVDRVERKLRLTGKSQPSPLVMRYLDEDNEWVNMETEDDLREAIRCVDDAEEVTLLVGSSRRTPPTE